MTRKQRLILFIACFGALFLVAPAVILHSQGYRFVLNPPAGGQSASWRIVQTGGFYFKILPKSAEIYLESQEKRGLMQKTKTFSRETDFLFGSALIKNLIPGIYEAEITKTDYHPWRKKLEIKEGQVTEAKNIILVAQDPEILIFDKDIKDFWVSTNGQKTGLLKETEKEWALEIFDSEKSEQKFLLKKEDLANSLTKPLDCSRSELLNLKFSSDSKRALVKALCFANQGEKQVVYFVLDLKEPLPTGRQALSIHPLDFLSEDILEPSFASINNSNIFFLKSPALLTPAQTSASAPYPCFSLFSADYEKRSAPSLVLDDLLAYTISGSNIIWLSFSGLIFQGNHLGQISEASEALTTTPLALNSETEYQLEEFSGELLLKEEKTLYFLDRGGKELKKISGDIKDFKISPDYKKVVLFNDHEIFVFFQEEELGQPPRKAGEKLFLSRFSEKINDCFWFTGHYLLFSVGDKIKIAEIDDRDKLNIVDIASPSSPGSKIFFNQKNKKLYILEQDNFYISKKLY